MNRYHLPCSAVAILLSLLLCWGAVPAIGAPIVLECLVKGVNNPDQPSIALGWKAAVVGLNSRSNWGMGSSTLTVNSSPSASIANSIYVAAAAASAIVPFGIYDDESTMAMMNAPQFSANNMVLMGPYTQSTGVRVWKDNIYFMSADPMAELIGLLNWVFSVNAAGKVRTTRIGWMFLSGGVFGTTLPTLMAAQLEMLGLPPPVSYTADVGSQFSSATFNTYMDKKPTCMFLFGARGAHTTSFFTALIQNAYVLENSNSFYVMMPFSLMYTTGAAYQTEYLKSKTSVVPMGNIRYSMPLPAPTDTTHAAVTQFQADMKTAIGQDGNALQSTSGYLMFYGWLFMQQIFYVTSTYVPYGVATLNYAAMKANMFRQNRYYLGDIVLGNYGGICPNMNTALKLGAACSCNQGGHFVAIGTISGVAAVNGDSSGVSISSVAPYYFPNNPCYTNQNVTVAYLPVNGAVVSMTSNSLASSLAAQAAAAFSGISAGEADLNAAPLTLSMTALTAATPSDASTAIATQSAQTQISVITGPVASPFLPEAMSDYLFLDPITVPTTLEPSSAPNAILLSATLRQQIFTVAGYLGSLVTQKSTLVSDGVNLRSSTLNDALVVDMVKYSLGYFNVPMRSAYGVGNTISLIDTLPTSGYTYVVGLDPKLLPALKSFLTTNTNAYVILSFDELTIYYDQFTAAFGTTSSAFMNRVLFATNVPSWTQTGTSNIFQKFVSATSAAAHTPAGMRTFLASMVALASNRQSTKTTADDMQALLYKTVTTEVDGLHFGPFVPSNAIASPPYLLSTVSNFGAQNISVWSYNRIVDPTTALLAEPVSMSVVYGNPATPIADPIVTTSTTTTTPEKATTTSTTTTTSTLPPCSLTSAPTTFPPPKTTTTTTTTVLPSKKHTQSDAWKYVLLVILGVLLVAVVLLLFRFGARVLPCFGGEPMHSAPVDSDAPTTVVFVEIEKWSDVQRAVPSAAAECIAEYRNIVRRLVEQHDCYEGGSLNDAFMVVTRNPMNALKFAGALQKKMELMQGPSVSAVDAAYADLGLSSGAVHGLRVRVGVHTDVVDIAYDVDTDHYEYRGAGCIAALRTERFAHGGQVLVTGSTCEALTEKQLAGVNAVSVGTKSFPEYEEPVPLFELVVLQHREFGGFQSDPVPVCTGDPALSMCTESAVLRDEELAEIALTREVLSIAFSPLPVKQRIKALTGECQLRGIRVPAHQRKIPDKSYATVLLDLLVYYTFMNTPKTALPYSAAMMDDAEKHKKNPQSTTTATSNTSAIDQTTDETTTENVRQEDDGSSNNDYLVLAQRGEEANPQFSQLSDSNRSLE